MERRREHFAGAIYYPVKPVVGEGNWTTLERPPAVCANKVEALFFCVCVSECEWINCAGRACVRGTWGWAERIERAIRVMRPLFPRVRLAGNRARRKPERYYCEPRTALIRSNNATLACASDCCD